MNKVKVTNANILLFAVVMLLVILPQILIPVMERAYNIDLGKLAKNNEAFKIILLLIDQYVFILIPIIVFTIITKPDIKETFRLKPINLSVSVLTVIMAAGAWFVSIFLTLIVYHIYSVIFGRPANPIDDIIPINMYLGMFLIALTPAVCEEALFRGIVLRAYENRGTVKAIIISACLFALIHFSIIRAVGPFIIGILAGYLVVKANSIIPGILTHMTFNGISLCIFYSSKTMPQQPETLPTVSQYLAMLLIVVFVLLITIACLIAFNYVTSLKNSSSKGYIYRLLFGNEGTISKPFNRSIASVKNDLISILTSWPIIIIILIFILLNVIDILEIIFK